MKKISFLLFLFVIGFSATAVSNTSSKHSVFNAYGESFTFVERGVEFAVYTDGQFDFFYNPRRNGYRANVVSPNLNISYNAGYNYDPFVQYDDFGAVIQIENVPVYYDNYGRIVQAGNIQISYNHFGRVASIGGLYLHYNPYQQLSYSTGYINVGNPYYVARAWHRYYMRPQANFVIVYNQPYRAYYAPNRIKYSYHKKYYKKNYNKGYKKSHYRPGEKITSYHRGKRTAQARDIRNNDSRVSNVPRTSRQHERNSVRSPSNSGKENRSYSRRENKTHSGSTPATKKREVRTSSRTKQEKASVRKTRATSKKAAAPAQVNRSSTASTQKKVVRSPGDAKTNKALNRNQRSVSKRSDATKANSSGRKATPKTSSRSSRRNSKI